MFEVGQEFTNPKLGACRVLGIQGDQLTVAIMKTGARAIMSVETR
jgi:hypothetical protein